MENTRYQSALIEYAKRLKLELYRQNPLLWLKERLGEDEKTVLWSLYGEEYLTHHWDGTKDPFYEMWMSLVRGEWVGVESATGTGKTYLLARVALWFLDTNHGSLVVTSAPKQDQLSLNLWKELRKIYHIFQKHRPYSELLSSLRLKADARKKDVESDETDWHIIGFVAGVGANEESATKAQGFHRARMLIITEETPGMSRAVMTAFENTCTDPKNNLILAVGNPDSQVDILHQFCKNSWVKHIRVSAFDHPNVVLNKKIVPGAVTNKSIERRKEKYGETSNFFKSRVRGLSPEQAVDSLIRLEWLKMAYQCKVVQDDSANAVGVDVASSEDGDKASLSWGTANTLIDIHTFQCPNPSHLAYNIIFDDVKIESLGYGNYQTRKIYDLGISEKNIGVDSVGVGVSTLNALHNEGYKAISLSGGVLDAVIPKDENGKNLYNFVSLRAQMYWELREDLRNGNLNIAVEDKIQLAYLEEELLLVKFVQNEGKIAVTKKEDIKKRLGRSTDRADSVVYWNWVRKGYYEDSTVFVPFWMEDE